MYPVLKYELFFNRETASSELLATITRNLAVATGRSENISDSLCFFSFEGNVYCLDDDDCSGSFKLEEQDTFWLKHHVYNARRDQ